MVLALVLVGGQNGQNEQAKKLTEAQTIATPGASRIFRDPAVLYQRSDHRVSLMAALEHLADSDADHLEPVAEVADATVQPATEPVVATEAPATPTRTATPAPRPTRTPEPPAVQSAPVAL